jgi:hypothetical protein
MTAGDYVLLAVAFCIFCYLIAVMLRTGNSR